MRLKYIMYKTGTFVKDKEISVTKVSYGSVYYPGFDYFHAVS